MRRIWLALILAALPGLAGAESPHRIVAVGGGVTEILYALGVQSRLVGADTTSLWPPAVEALPKVGYMRQLAAEGVLSLKPDLVVAIREAGPPPVFDQLRGAGVHTVRVDIGLTPDRVPDAIRAVADAVGETARGQALADTVAQDLAVVAAAVAKAARRPRVLFLLSASRGAPLAAGRETIAQFVIQAAGGVNAITGFEGYKALATEAIVNAAPDVLLLTTQSVTQLGGWPAVTQLPGLGLTPAVAGRRTVDFDALYLMGLGPRAAHAIRDLAHAFHPDLALPDLPLRPWTAP